MQVLKEVSGCEKGWDWIMKKDGTFVCEDGKHTVTHEQLRAELVNRKADAPLHTKAFWEMTEEERKVSWVHSPFRVRSFFRFICLFKFPFFYQFVRLS